MRIIAFWGLYCVFPIYGNLRYVMDVLGIDLGTHFIFPVRLSTGLGCSNWVRVYRYKVI